MFRHLVHARALHTRARKELYERIHTQTKHGGAPGNVGHGRGKAPIKVAKLATLIPDDADNPATAAAEADASTAPSSLSPDELAIQIAANKQQYEKNASRKIE